MSGLQIFNAHPALYWGKVSTFDHPAFSAQAGMTADNNEIGVTTIGNHSFVTTGLSRLCSRCLGPTGGTRLSRLGDHSRRSGSRHRAARGHFTFAWLFVINGLIYLVYSLCD